MLAPFNVLVPSVSDADLGPLLTELHARGLKPTVTPIGTPTPRRSSIDGPGAGLPSGWTLIRELPGQSYAWPTYNEDYLRYRIFAGDTAREGRVHIALGEAGREKAWGRDRRYIVAFLTSGKPQTALVEFLEVDDYEETRDYVAVIRGSGGGKKMYDPADLLPSDYAENFQIVIYRDRVDYPRAWNKLAVIVNEADHVGMLNHALLQARRRGDV